MSTKLQLFVLILLLAGCQSPEIATYKAPRDKPSLPQMGSTMGTATSATPTSQNTQTTQDTLNWTLPKGWIEKPPSAMRLANFDVKTKAGTVDVSVTKLEGTAGGLTANINRWRGQIGLPPSTPEEVEKSLERRAQGELHIWVTVLKGETSHILVAIVELHGFSWFFKAMGPSAAIQEMTPQFNHFIEGLQHVH